VITIDIDYERLADAVVSRMAPTASESDGFLDVAAAARYLCSTPSAIRSLVKRDAIPHYRAPNRRLLFDRDELRRWVTSR
jgi:hypothetical protein